MRDMEYLGDAVYVGHDGYHIWLATGDHKNLTDPHGVRIALEPAVFAALVDYHERIRDEGDGA